MTNRCTYTPVFNEHGPHLVRLLDSLKDWEVKRAYFVDGPFHNCLGHGAERSTDGTREIIKSYDFTTLIDSGVNYMPIKSNLAMHAAARDGAECVLVLGADEWLEGPINLITLPRDEPMGNVYITEHNPTGKYNKAEWINPRMILKPAFVRSIDIHWFWFYVNQLVEFEIMPIIEGIMIHADDNLRPKERDDEMTSYQDWHAEVERKVLIQKYFHQFLSQEFPPTISISGNKYYTCGCIIRPDGVRLKKCKKHFHIKPKL
jgi:hypothetical protein